MAATAAYGSGKGYGGDWVGFAFGYGSKSGSYLLGRFNGNVACERDSCRDVESPFNSECLLGMSVHSLNSGAISSNWGNFVEDKNWRFLQLAFR